MLDFDQKMWNCVLKSYFRIVTDTIQSCLNTLLQPYLNAYTVMMISCSAVTGAADILAAQPKSE